MPLKGISYLELWQSFCSAEHNHLCNFGRPRGTMLCNYFEFGSVVKEMSLKRFIWSSGDPSCSVERNHLCNFGKRASWGTIM